MQYTEYLVIVLLLNLDMVYLPHLTGASVLGGVTWCGDVLVSWWWQDWRWSKRGGS